jgi:hypothetical protein
MGASVKCRSWMKQTVGIYVGEGATRRCYRGYSTTQLALVVTKHDANDDCLSGMAVTVGLTDCVCDQGVGLVVKGTIISAPCAGLDGGLALCAARAPGCACGTAAEGPRGRVPASASAPRLR